MEYEEIKVGETYNVRVKVIHVDAHKNARVNTVDENGKQLGVESTVFYAGELRAFSPITHENGIENIEPVPKYDLCRLFRKGDRVRIIDWNGRAAKSDKKNKLWLVMNDEKECRVDIEYRAHGCKIMQGMHPCHLELITPAEEIEPFYVCENTESKSFEVRRKEDHKVQVAFYYFNDDDTHAKSEAAKATLEHCDRLNAKNRKEQQQ